MAQQPNHLEEKLDEFKKEVKDEIGELRKDMQGFRDFMVIQIDRQKRRKTDGSIDWNGIIKQLLVALVAALTVIGTLVGLLGKGVK